MAANAITGAVTIITLIGLALIDLAPRIVALWQEAPAEQHEQKAAKK